MKYLILFFTFIIISCNKSAENGSKIDNTFTLTSLSKTEYPDNPDYGYTSVHYREDYFKNGNIHINKDSTVNFKFYSEGIEKDSILLESISLKEFIPHTPTQYRKDSYLDSLSIINQEWNRNQVKFQKEYFKTNNPKITRIDIARNCLNAYLWEIIAYTQEGDKELPYSHAWFDFPHQLYQQYFKSFNNNDFSKYGRNLEEWKDIQQKKIDLSIIRNQTDDLKITFEDMSGKMYPLKGERERKFKEIVSPKVFKTMRDLQNDSTTFATFSPPGFYNRKDPRKTELGRLFNLKNISLRKIKTPGKQDLREIELLYNDSKSKRQTRIFFGGIDFNELPILDSEDCNIGWASSMGFGNHTFYEDYKHQQLCATSTSPYYGFITNEKLEWLDSHKVGIDGPLLHFDKKGNLHIWILSFERHALVGHYMLKLI